MKTLPYPIPAEEQFVFAHNNGDGTASIYYEGDELPVMPIAEPAISITPRQFRQALTRANLRQSCDSMIANSDQDVRDWYEFATSFESNHPVVLQMAQAMGKTKADVDALFALGERL